MTFLYPIRCPKACPMSRAMRCPEMKSPATIAPTPTNATAPCTLQQHRQQHQAPNTVKRCKRLRNPQVNLSTHVTVTGLSAKADMR